MGEQRSARGDGRRKLFSIELRNTPENFHFVRLFRFRSFPSSIAAASFVHKYLLKCSQLNRPQKTNEKKRGILNWKNMCVLVVRRSSFGARRSGFIHRSRAKQVSLCIEQMIARANTLRRIGALLKVMGKETSNEKSMKERMEKQKRTNYYRRLSSAIQAFFALACVPHFEYMYFPLGNITFRRINFLVVCEEKSAKR